ncbi:unnamed protein product [Symbiodinium sp. CCMP2456]|nr:unnamed protein product [Symbiodinium sp. CCMP2456]
MPTLRETFASDDRTERQRQLGELTLGELAQLQSEISVLLQRRIRMLEVVAIDGRREDLFPQHMQE